jgi:hypothetical protein
MSCPNISIQKNPLYIKTLIRKRLEPFVFIVIPIKYDNDLKIIMQRIKYNLVSNLGGAVVGTLQDPAALFVLLG